MAGPLTAPQMFALARRLPLNPGPHRCFYCGGGCDGTIPAAGRVKASFTARDTVAGGQWLCAGCVAAMDERARIPMCDGTWRDGQKVRCYSWVVTPQSAVAATKAHRAWLYDACLDPPGPPAAIVLSDAGQRHLLYRGAVWRGGEEIVITLEGEPVVYRPAELVARLELCKRVAAVLGRPALSESLSPNALAMIGEHHRDESLPDRWRAVRETPLTRLAAWFAPAKKECQNEYPRQ